jgi:hypothetical protein
VTEPHRRLTKEEWVEMAKEHAERSGAPVFLRIRHSEDGDGEPAYALSAEVKIYKPLGRAIAKIHPDGFVKWMERRT